MRRGALGSLRSRGRTHEVLAIIIFFHGVCLPPGTAGRSGSVSEMQGPQVWKQAAIRCIFFWWGGGLFNKIELLKGSWTRKGFLHFRLRLNGQVVDFVNVHLFHGL